LWLPRKMKDRVSFTELATFLRAARDIVRRSLQEKHRRMDQRLTVAGLAKRRTVAKDMADQGRVKVNGRAVESSYDVKIDDRIDVGNGAKATKDKVLNSRETTNKAEASELYELVG